MVLQTQYNNRTITKNTVIQLTDFKLKGNRDKIFKVLDCHVDSPVYEEMIEIYGKVLREATELADPKAAIYIEENDNTHSMEELRECKEVIYSCLTVGESLPQIVMEKFSQGDYLEGMILDSIADHFTFEIFDDVYSMIYDYLKENNLGTVRLSPGERGFDIKHHEVLKEKLQMESTIGVDITESYMLYPVKSTSSVFVVDEGIRLTKKLHECRKCSDLTCKWRQESYEDKNR